MTSPLTLRVAVMDVWDELPMTVDASLSVRELKAQALRAARVTDDPAEYLLKFRGAELRNESASLAAADVPTGAALIVMTRRRRAVR